MVWILPTYLCHDQYYGKYWIDIYVVYTSTNIVVYVHIKN